MGITTDARRLGAVVLRIRSVCKTFGSGETAVHALHDVKLVWADAGCSGEQAGSDATQNGIDQQVVKLIYGKKGFVLLPGAGSPESSLRKGTFVSSTF